MQTTPRIEWNISFKPRACLSLLILSYFDSFPPFPLFSPPNIRIPCVVLSYQYRITQSFEKASVLIPQFLFENPPLEHARDVWVVVDYESLSEWIKEIGNKS